MRPTLASEFRPWWAMLKSRSVWPWFVVWVGLFVTGITVGWIIVEHMVQEHRDAGLALVEARLQARVKSYGRQLDDLIERLDDVGQVLMAEWAKHPKQQNFNLILAGIYPHGKTLYVAFLDKQGRVTAASFTPKAQDIGNSRFFDEHRRHCCEGWQLTPVERSPLVGSDVLRMSHALSDAQGNFAGVLTFGMTPDLLTAFEDDSVIGSRDFVSVYLVNGPVLTSKQGQGPATRIFYRQTPDFLTGQGMRLESGAAFSDGIARYVAWRRHAFLPLVAVASIAAEDAMANVATEVRIYHTVAVLMTLLLLLFCGTGLAVGGSLLARRAAEEEIRKVYRTATDAANEGFYMLRVILDNAGDITDVQFEDVNERGGVLLGQSRQLLLGQPASRLLAPAVWAELRDFVRRALEHQVVEDEHRVLAASELPSKWFYRHAVAVGDCVALTLRDISEVKAHEEELLELAHRDTLTGLPNRLWFHRFMTMAIQRAMRSHKLLGVLFIDLDDFKTVNDTLGHDAGDQVLKDVARQLRSTLRGSDHLVRLGGDEFLVIIEGIDDVGSIEAVARKLISAVEREFRPDDNMLGKVGASIGISIFPQDGDCAEDLLKHADIAMYQAKASGRGQACRYIPEYSSKIAERLSSEQALRTAIERDELVVHFQPKVKLESGLLSGAEALVRWECPERGLRMPGTFIGLAEDIGLIVPIGESVIRHVLAQMAAWRQAGLPEVRVAINVSPEQLRCSDVSGYLQQQLTLNEVPASLIDVEITESAMVEQSESVRLQLARLRAMGVRLVIDDFGAGYSSLAQLQRLDVDVIKLDRELVRPLWPGTDAEALSRGIIWMASALDLEVVAEGVETLEQLHVLVDVGCDEIQGYLFSEPLAPGAFEQLLRHPHTKLADWLGGAAADGEALAPDATLEAS